MKMIFICIGGLISTIMLASIMQDARLERQAKNELMERQIDSLRLERDINISIYWKKMRELPNSDRFFGLEFSIDSTEIECRMKIKALKEQ
jgi:hypothetical protein